MELTIKEFASYGFGGLLTGVVIAFAWFLTVKVLPKLMREHVATLQKAHERCEGELAKVSDDFRRFLLLQHDAHKQTMERLANANEKMEDALSALVKEFRK